MGHWIIGGKQYSEEEYEVYKEQEEERRERVQEETWRLIRTLAEAYTTCEKYIDDNPQYPYGMKDDAQQREFKIYEKLRSNLGAANQAPRCEKVREDGTKCGSPKMKGYGYCYGHERMLQMQSQKLELPAQDDPMGIQMAIMRVQKALIDDEISDKKAGLLLYSLQMASSNLKYAMSGQGKKEVVTEMPDAPIWLGLPTSRVIETQISERQISERQISEDQISPLIDTDDSDESLFTHMNADDASDLQAPTGKGENSPRMRAEKRGSMEKLPNMEMQKPLHYGDAEARRNPQPERSVTEMEADGTGYRDAKG